MFEDTHYSVSYAVLVCLPCCESWPVKEMEIISVPTECNAGHDHKLLFYILKIYRILNACITI